MATGTNKSDQLPSDEIERLIELFLSFESPNKTLIKSFYRIIKSYFKPTLVGVDNIPDRPTLFIGNHAMFAVDGLVLMPTIYQETGRFPRGMGDKFLFHSAIGEKLAEQGLVLAHPEVCSALMEAGQDLVVFPGGAAEANKAADEKYTLQWRERTGFVRMAAMHGYNITPFGLVGPDEWYDQALQGKDLKNSTLFRILNKTGIIGDDFREDMIPPIPRGMFYTLLPKPQRCYLAFGEAIEVPDYRGKKRVSKSVQQRVQADTATAVEGLIADMLLLRAQNKPHESVLRRYLTR